MDRTPGGTRWLTLRQSEEEMGVSPEAVRKRIKRGTLDSDKGEDGRRYVYLDADPDARSPGDGRHTQAEGEGSLVEEMRDQVLYLREQVRREQDAHAEARRIIAALTQRIPQLEAPASPEPPIEPESPAPTPTLPLPTETKRRRRPPRGRGASPGGGGCLGPEPTPPPDAR